MYKIAEEEMVICPYNRYHVVSKLRIQKHITKCKENNPDVKLSTCFYNYCHRLNPENMLAHYGVCSHKTRLQGSRYESCNNSTEKSDKQSGEFPNIDVKPQFFCNHFTPSHSSTQLSCENIDELGSSDSSETESTFKIKFSDDVDISVDDNDDEDDDDDLEPLPLPKTVSKAFTCAKLKTDTLSATSAKISQLKGFGRAKNFLACSPPKPSRTTEHLLPDLRNFDCNTTKEEISSRVLPNNSTSSSTSIVSSMFDETSTFKSEEVISNKDDSDGDNTNAFILENFDKYTKL